MCLATVANCERCQRSSCRGIDICSDAQSRGMIHITPSAYDTAVTDRHTATYGLPIDAFACGVDTFLIKIYTVMNQKRIQTQNCSLCDSPTAREEYPSLHSRCCSTTHKICENCCGYMDHGPMRLCEAVTAGLIHIRGDAYDKAHDGKVKVPVSPKHRPGKRGQWALVYEVMEEDKKLAGFCWGCRRG